MSVESERPASPGVVSRRVLLRRGAAVAGALAVPSALMQACGGGSSGGGSSAGGATIRYIKGPFGDQDRKWMQAVDAPFLAANRDVDVALSFYAWASRDAQMAAAYAGGSPPDLAYLGDGIWVPYAKGGALADITSRVKSAAFQHDYSVIPSRFWEACTVNGKIYGIPLYTSASLLMVNTDLMRKAGVEDWKSSTTALRKAAAQVKARTGQWGFGTTTSFAEFSYGTILPAIWAAGAQLYDQGMTKATVDTPAVAAQLEVFRDMFVQDRSAPAPGLYDGQGLAGLFTGGKLAVLSSFSDGALAFLPNAKFNWELVPMPPLVSGGDPSTYVAVGAGFISARSSVQDDAWKYLSYLASKPAVEKYRTFVPAIFGCREDVRPISGSKPVNADSAYFKQVVVPFGRAVPPIPNATTALRALGDQFEQLASGKQSGAATAKGMNDQLQAALAF